MPPFLPFLLGAAVGVLIKWSYDRLRQPTSSNSNAQPPSAAESMLQAVPIEHESELTLTPVLTAEQSPAAETIDDNEQSTSVAESVEAVVFSATMSEPEVVIESPADQPGDVQTDPSPTLKARRHKNPITTNPRQREP